MAHDRIQACRYNVFQWNKRNCNLVVTTKLQCRFQHNTQVCKFVVTTDLQCHQLGCFCDLVYSLLQRIYQVQYTRKNKGCDVHVVTNLTYSAFVVSSSCLVLLLAFLNLSFSVCLSLFWRLFCLLVLRFRFMLFIL